MLGSCIHKTSMLCSRLRILAAGGDGTVAWILKTVRELQLDPPPAVAVMPLGTGNDLSLSFGWGNTFLHKWIAVSCTLDCFAGFFAQHCLTHYMLQRACQCLTASVLSKAAMHIMQILLLACCWGSVCSDSFPQNILEGAFGYAGLQDAVRHHETHSRC